MPITSASLSSVFNRFNQGQVCTAGARIFVQEKIYDKFLEAFTKKMKGGKIGDPFELDTALGPQVTQTHFNVRTLLKDDAMSNAGPFMAISVS